MSHNYLNKSRTQELINTIRGHLSDIATVLSNLASGDARDNTKAPINHTQASNTITSMTGYSKPASTSAIAATDTLNEAIGKLEKGLEDAGGGSEGLEEHIETNVEDEGGVHGIRCYNGKLEVYNAYSEEWLDPSEVGVAVGNVSDLAIVQGKLSLSLKWSDPDDTEDAVWAGTKVVMKAGAYPQNIADGQLIYDNQVRDAYSNTPLIVNNLTEGITYYFTLFPYTTTGIITTDDANRISAEAVNPYELGLRADFVNKTFTRLGDAVGLSGGSDFDDFPMYKRRRCNLADNGTVNAYLGDEDYAVTGSNGQVMVEQPKFYYKVVPVTLNASDNKQLDVAEYWVTNKPLVGYKLHPAFYNTSGQEIDYFYEGAYEGYVSSNKLGSISGVASTASLGRASFRSRAANRGTGWRQETIWSLSADQLLMIIEYGKFNMQEAIGNGNTMNYSKYLNTGTINSYGNASYGTTANSTTAAQWRGKENAWGNRYAWIDGINFYGYVPFIANDYNFTDGTANYTQLGFNIADETGGYIGRFGYDANYDWIFIPYGSTRGDSAGPVGDTFASRSFNSLREVESGGCSTSMNNAGVFHLDATITGSSSSDYNNNNSARLLYVG